MARADRLKAGAPQISAGNLNKVVEQSNRLDSFQGGPGINSQNDATGLQMQNNRRRPVADADSPFGSSSPFRSTIKKRSDTTRHKGELELYGSSGVSALARAVSSSIPQWYGMPFLPVAVSGVIGQPDGDGALVWGIMDADQYGSSGPRSLERRASSSGDRFQVYAFDDAASTLDSSEVTQTAVRRRYGSSGNHYIAWVNSSDLESSGAAATTPRWDQILDATTDVNMLSDTNATSVSVGDDLNIGTAARKWADINLTNRAETWIRSGDQGTGAWAKNTISVFGNNPLDEPHIRLSVYNGELQLNTFHSGDITLRTAGQLLLVGIPTTTPGGSDRVWNDGGTLKIT